MVLLALVLAVGTLLGPGVAFVLGAFADYIVVEARRRFQRIGALGLQEDGQNKADGVDDGIAQEGHHKIQGVILPPLCMPGMITVIAHGPAGYPGSYEGYFLPCLVAALPALVVFERCTERFRSHTAGRRTSPRTKSTWRCPDKRRRR